MSRHVTTAPDPPSMCARELPVRIIPCLDLRDGRVVKGTRFVDLRDAGSPVELAARYAAEGADELVLLDITASSEARSATVRVVRDVARVLRIPLTVGGGIASADDVVRLLEAGADKVSLNTAAVMRPQLITEAARRVGEQAIVVAIDARRNPAGNAEVWVSGGHRPTGLPVLDWARAAAGFGAGELLVTSMDRDGTAQGYDLALLAELVAAVSVPVIASGGAGTVDHVAEACLVAGVQAVLAAGMFHYGRLGIPTLKRELHRRGIPVRM